MKTLALAATLAAALLGAAPAGATNVGISIDIAQPGVYGRIDIGRFPQPQLVLPNPVVIGRPVIVQPEPVYLWVPPGHRRDWRRHCGRYNACGVPVYFVRHDWYDRHVRHDGRRRRTQRGRQGAIARARPGARRRRPQQEGMQDKRHGQRRQQRAPAPFLHDRTLKTHDALIPYGNCMILHRRSDSTFPCQTRPIR